jgi:uncharacterized lipoprotein YehR (DUF1307 family)
MIEMKQVQNILKHILFGFVLILTLTGCFNIEQSLTLNKDGTGSLDIKTVVYYDEIPDEEFDEEFVSLTKEEVEAMTDTSLVKVEYVNETSKGSQRTVDIRYLFEDISVLSKPWCSDSNRISIEREEGFIILKWIYATNDGTEDDTINIDKWESVYEGHFCKFNLVVPSEIVEVSSGGEIRKDKKTAHWKFPIITYMKGEVIELTAKIKQW